MTKISESYIDSIVKMPLQVQCETLNIPLVNCDLVFDRKPEKYCVKHFAHTGTWE